MSDIISTKKKVKGKSQKREQILDSENLKLVAGVHSSGIHNLSSSKLKVMLPEPGIQIFFAGVHSTGMKMLFTLLRFTFIPVFYRKGYSRFL